MDKLRKKNLFIEINDDYFLIAVGEYDEELNFKIIEKEIFSPIGFKNGKITNFETCVESLKKVINKIENKCNIIFSDVNAIINETDLDCVNVSGFKKLNGNQILSEDISYILNDIKSKLEEIESNKTIIHLFNTKYLLDNTFTKNLPIGLYGDFYSHQLTFFMINNNEIKNIKNLFNKCNLNLKKIILKSFTEGIKIYNREKKDTFIKININKDHTKLIVFDDTAYSFFQKFNFGSDIILRDISKVCSLDISKVRDIVINTNFEISDQNMFIDKKYFNENRSRKISLKHLIEISAARIEEMINIIFNNNKNLYNIKDNKTNLFLDFDDKKINYQFKGIFQNSFKNCILNIENPTDKELFKPIEIYGDLLSKGWAREAIPVLTKKNSWISRIFSNLFE